jgi:structural maintenance of chromosome 4
MAYKRGELKGLVPMRLGDLVTIERKYDLAISNSCGFLDHFVVDTVEEAQACI